jgi:hypothetical protein
VLEVDVPVVIIYWRIGKQSRNGLKINFIKSTAHQSFARRLTEIILKLRKLHKKLALS